MGPENIDALAKVTAAVNTPTCVGERRYTRFGFRDLIAAQAVDMIMPDVVRAGGIAETKKIAAMAESYYMQVSPHNPNSAISTLASIHLMANIPNALVLEYVDDEQECTVAQRSVDGSSRGGKWLPTTSNETGIGITACDEGSGKTSV